MTTLIIVILFIGLSCVHSNILEDVNREDFSEFIEESKSNGEKLLSEVENPDLKILKNYLEDINAHMLSLDSIITSGLKSLTPYKKQLVESAVKVCSIDLEYAFKYIEVKINSERFSQRKSLLNSMKEKISTAKRNLEYLGSKMIDFNDAISSGNHDKMIDMIQDLQDSIQINAFMNYLKTANLFLNVLINISENYMPLGLINPLKVIYYNIIDTWIKDFELKNDLSHSIKAFHLSYNINLFNQKYDEIVSVQEDDQETKNRLETFKRELNAKNNEIQRMISGKEFNSGLLSKLESLSEIIKSKLVYA